MDCGSCRFHLDNERHASHTNPRRGVARGRRVTRPLSPGLGRRPFPGFLRGGRPYFPHAGNGGYDVQHYDLKLRYTPKSGEIDSTATITAKATKGLSRFNLDLSGSDRPVDHGRRQEGQMVPQGPGADRSPRRRASPTTPTFKVVVDYDGRPRPVDDADLGVTGFIHTRTGPSSSPSPTAPAPGSPPTTPRVTRPPSRYEISAPAGLTVLANGEPQNSGIVRVKKGYVVSRWTMKQPMAPYLAMIAIGKYKVSEGTAGGVPQHHRLRPGAGQDRQVPAQGDRRGDQVGHRALRPLPLRLDRRHRRQARRPLRPGDPGPPGLRRRRQRRPADRPRDRAPVVRQQRRPGVVERHLAERGPGQLRRVALRGDPQRPDRQARPSTSTTRARAPSGTSRPAPPAS